MLCWFDGCPRQTYSKGLCHGHFQQLRRGRPLRALSAPENICSFHECDRPVIGRGLCNAHYQQQRKGRPLTPVRVKDPDAVCFVTWCERSPYAKGLCNAHYQQQLAGRELGPIKKMYGNPEKWFWECVSIAPGCWVWNGRLNHAGYGVLPSGDRPVLAHRFAYQLLRGDVPSGMELDHHCRNRKCVNPDHLRPVTSGQNHQNTVARNTLGLRGVSPTKAGRWRARVTLRGREHHLGVFDSAEEAAEVARLGRLRLHTHSDGR